MTRKKTDFDLGISIIMETCWCPRCTGSLSSGRTDIDCHFCHFSGEIITERTDDIHKIGGIIREREKAEVRSHIHLFIVKISENGKSFSVFYAPTTHNESSQLFTPSRRNNKKLVKLAYKNHTGKLWVCSPRD